MLFCVALRFVLLSLICLIFDFFFVNVFGFFILYCVLVFL